MTAPCYIFCSLPVAIALTARSAYPLRSGKSSWLPGRPARRLQTLEHFPSCYKPNNP